MREKATVCISLGCWWRKAKLWPISRTMSSGDRLSCLRYRAVSTPTLPKDADQRPVALPIYALLRMGLPSRHVATTLVVSYTTVSAFLSPAYSGQRESSFLRHFPSGRPAWPLASILPCGARTFLTCEHAARAIAWPALRWSIVARPARRSACPRVSSNAPHI